MYFEFSRRSRSTSQPSVGESLRKDSNATNGEENEAFKSKVGTPSEAYRSFSFRYYNSLKNASNSQVTPNSLQTDQNSLKVVKSSDTIPKSVSFYYQVKASDTKKSSSFSLQKQEKQESWDSNMKQKIKNQTQNLSSDSGSNLTRKNDKNMNEITSKKSNFLGKLFSKNKSVAREQDEVKIESETNSSIKPDANFCNHLGSILKKKEPKKNTIDQHEIDELLKPSPQLPMVKFDDDGDFFKENLPKFMEEDERKKSNSHIIYIGESISIDTQKVKKYLKRAFKFAFSQIGLAGLVVGYVILGALLFMKIESNYEKENQNKIEKNREEFFESIKISAENLFNSFLAENFHTQYSIYRKEEILKNNKELPQDIYYGPIYKPSIKNKTNAGYTQAYFSGYYSGKDSVRYDKKSYESKKKPSWFIELERENFFNEIKSHLRNLLIENDKIEDKEKPNMLGREDIWNYPNALLYSATVITTIGYGNITPKSNTGKILTIFYAMIGIPLMFMCLTNTGDLLAELFIISYSKCIRFIYRRIFKHKLKIPYSSSKFEENKQEMLTEFEMEYDNPNDRHVPIVATLGVLTAYIFAGACIFAFTEDWSILDGAYFCFITFTTIGFGDFVPGKNTLATEKRGMIALCTLYLLVGMVIMAMCFKLMQDEVASKARWFGLRLGIIDQ